MKDHNAVQRVINMFSSHEAGVYELYLNNVLRDKRVMPSQATCGHKVEAILQTTADWDTLDEVEEIPEPRVTLRSSYGYISFDEDGTDPQIPEGQKRSYLNDITQIDVLEWCYMYPGEDPTANEHDILDFGSWGFGKYEPAEPGWRDDLRRMRAGEEI